MFKKKSKKRKQKKGQKKTSFKVRGTCPECRFAVDKKPCAIKTNVRTKEEEYANSCMYFTDVPYIPISGALITKPFDTKTPRKWENGKYFVAENKNDKGKETT